MDTNKKTRMYVKLCNTLRLLALFVTAFLTWMVFNNKRIFDYDSMWARIMNRAEVTSQFDNCLKAFILIAFFGAMLLFLKSFFSRFYEERIILDCMANLAVVLAVILEIVLTKLLYRGNVLFEKNSTKGFLIITCVMTLFMIVHFIISCKLKKIIKADGPIEEAVMERRNSSIKIAKIFCILYLIAMVIPVVISFVSYMKFLPNYGIMGKHQLAYSEEMMNDYMNYCNDGVFVQDDLYYLSSNKQEIYVYHTENKMSELFWSGENSFFCITSDDTYLYVGGYRTNSEENNYAELIKRINIETGECEELFATNEMYIQGIAVRDGILYYYTEERGGSKNTIYCIEISENMDFASAKVYVNCLSDIYLAFEPDNALYLAYVGGYPKVFREGHLGMQVGTGIYITKIGDYFYNLISEDFSSYGNEKISYHPAVLVRYQEDDNSEVVWNNIIAEDVTAYNQENQLLYYAVATEEGFEIYESNPDGSNQKCIASGQGGTRVQALYTTENYIVYSYGNNHLEEVDERITGMDCVAIQ